MTIPPIELIAMICLYGKGNPPRALRQDVKHKLCQMFAPFEATASYSVEWLIVTAKAMDLVREDGDWLEVPSIMWGPK